MATGKVIPKPILITDAEYRALLGAGIRRASAADGVARLALAIGCDERTLRNARDGRSSLSGASHWNLFAADPSALDELAAHFGMRMVPIDATAGADAELNADIARLSSVVADAMRDGRIDHIEQGKVVAAARPVVQELAGRIAAAGRVS